MRLAKPGAYFRATHQDAEWDLLLLRGARRIGVEFQQPDVPQLGRGMRIEILRSTDVGVDVYGPIQASPSEGANEKRFR